MALAQRLHERGCALKLRVDSVVAAQAIVASGQRFEVTIKIDTDGHRADILPEDALLLEVGRTLHEGGAVLHGVMTHAGASCECRTPAALVAMAEQERGRCVRAAECLRAAGLPCPEVGVGTRLRVLPNHACATAAQFPAYAVLGAGGAVQTWPRFYGW